MAAPLSSPGAPRPVSTPRAVAGLAALALWLGWVIPLLYQAPSSRVSAVGITQAVCSPAAPSR